MRTLIAGLVLALAACGGGKDSTGPVNVVGTWTLATVDAKPLPFTLLAATSTSCGVDVRSGQFDLKDGGTYTGVEAYGTVVGGTLYCAASYVESGTYTVSSGVVTLQNGKFTHALTIARDALARTSDGHQFVYHK